MFSAGDAYERFMGRWSRLLAPQLAEFAGVRDGETLLDIGSGTGSLTAALAAIAPSSRIIGIDPSPPFVAFARSRHPDARVRFDVGDAQRIPLADTSIDRTLSLLIFNFIPDPTKALAEMIRVTRRGGVVVAAVWDYGAGMAMLRTFWDEAIALAPAMDAKDERHMPLSKRGDLARLWKAAGLEVVEEAALDIECRFASFDDYWTPFLEKQGPAGAFIAALSDDDREQLRQRLQHRLVPADDGTIVLPARAWAVRGVVR